MNECFHRCSQDLGVLKSVSERKFFRYREYSQYLFRDLCTAGSAILVVFRGSILLCYTLLMEYCCTSRNSGTCTAGTKYWQYFVRLALRVLVLRVLRVLGVVSKCCQYPDHLSVHRRFDNFIRILLLTAFTVHGWSHEWELNKLLSGGKLQYFDYWQYFGNMLRALEISTGSTSVSNYFECLYCGYCFLYSGFCTTHHAPHTRSI